MSQIFTMAEKKVETAIRDNFSHLLFVDDDIWFKTEAFDFLIKRDTDFAAANYIKKPSLDQIFRSDFKSIPVTFDLDGNHIYSKNRSGVEEVGFCGLGFSLIKVSAVKDIKDPFLGPEHGEDYNFCRNLRQSGKKIFVDHDATRYVAHIGNYPFQE